MPFVDEFEESLLVVSLNVGFFIVTTDRLSRTIASLLIHLVL